MLDEKMVAIADSLAAHLEKQLQTPEPIRFAETLPTMGAKVHSQTYKTGHGVFAKFVSEWTIHAGLMAFEPGEKGVIASASVALRYTEGGWSHMGGSNGFMTTLYQLVDGSWVTMDEYRESR